MQILIKSGSLCIFQQILQLLTLLALLTCAVHQFIKIIFKIILLVVILMCYITSIVVLTMIYGRHCEPW